MADQHEREVSECGLTEMDEFYNSYDYSLDSYKVCDIVLFGSLLHQCSLCNVMVMMLTRNYAVNVVHAAFVGGIIGWILGPKKVNG